MRPLYRKCFYGFIVAALVYITIAGVLASVTKGRHLDPTFDLENQDWIASGKSWLDRAVCRWFGLCGTFHLFHRTAHIRSLPWLENFTDYWLSGNVVEWSHKERQLREIPQYVFDHAPYVHLFSGEEYWPTDLAEHLVHTSPHLNYTELFAGVLNHSASLDELNDIEGGLSGRNVYLQSTDDVEQEPDWLRGKRHIPVPAKILLDDSRETGRLTEAPFRPTLRHHQELRRRALESPVTRQQQIQSGKSTAPAFLIVVPKEDDIIDAFWFFFYSFNKAPKVLNIQFGNHIGDWEHTLIRFQNGKPQYVSLSEHHFGAAYAWQALEKYLPGDSETVFGSWSNETAAEHAKRPVVYSAIGSHAMYATPGLHPYILPGGILHDSTDRGPLWDPTLNLHSYTYDLETIRSSTRNPKSPTDWFDYSGHWGDKYYLLSDPRQYRFAGQYHYMNGPYGPKIKHLDRKEVCQGLKKCHIKHLTAR